MMYMMQPFIKNSIKMMRYIVHEETQCYCGGNFKTTTPKSLYHTFHQGFLDGASSSSSSGT